MPVKLRLTDHEGKSIETKAVHAILGYILHQGTLEEQVTNLIAAFTMMLNQSLNEKLSYRDLGYILAMDKRKLFSRIEIIQYDEDEKDAEIEDVPELKDTP